MRQIICMNSYLGRQNKYLLCPEGMKKNEGVRVVNDILRKLHTDVNASLPKGATGGDFQDAVAKGMAPLLATAGFEMIELERLPKTIAWNN